MNVFQYLVLDNYELGDENDHVRVLKKKLWEECDESYLGPLFGSYKDWLARRIIPNLVRAGVNVNGSHFPGDLCVEVNLEGHLPLCIVGLNSAWIQYKEGDFERKLELPMEQFHAALKGDTNASSMDILKRHSTVLLLMHHPPTWLSRSAMRKFNENIYIPRFISLCLHGHWHEGRSESTTISGGSTRYYFQAPSLFGLEHYGTLKVRPAIGYALGKLSADGEIRVWPLERVVRGSGGADFVYDHLFKNVTDEGMVLRPPNEPAPSPITKRNPPPAKKPQLIPDTDLDSTALGR